MKLFADVKLVGITKHSVADAALGHPRELPPPTRVEIVDEGDGVYLYRYDASDQLLADTWHEDVAAAKKQASFEFGIQEQEWREDN